MERVALVKLNPLVREEISSYKRSLLTFVGHSILSDYILTFTDKSSSITYRTIIYYK